MLHMLHIICPLTSGQREWDRPRGKREGGLRVNLGWMPRCFEDSGVFNQEKNNSKDVHQAEMHLPESLPLS